MFNCTGACCRWGVFADVKEREKIFDNAGMIQKYLEPSQENSPDKWFEKEEHADLDFPSGMAVGTNAGEKGCVFLDSRGLCVLQKTAIGEGMHPYSLKPFYCIAFPIVISEHVLTIDEMEVESRPNCCSVSPAGAKNIIEICSTELEFMLGNEGLEELKRLFGERNAGG